MHFNCFPYFYAFGVFVLPLIPTLLGYWKCNDASGNTVKDYSMYGNDGVAKYDIIWPQGIEIPKLNENNE